MRYAQKLCIGVFMAEKRAAFYFKNRKNRIKKREKKNATVYARYLSGYKWYCPDSFRPIDAAFAFLAAIIAFIVLPYILVLIVKICGGFMSQGVIYCLSAVLSQAVIIGVAAVFCKVRKVPMFSGGGFCLKFDIKAFLPAILLTLATAILISPVHNEFSELLSGIRSSLGIGEGGGEDIVLNLADAKDLFAFAFVYLIVVPVFPAICEEALFRGVIARGFKPLGDFSAAVLSGFLFAIMHGNYSQFLLQFILGVEIGYVVLKTGNFAIGAVMHFTNNAFAIFNAAAVAFGFVVSGTFSYIMQAAIILFGTASLFLSVFLWARYYKKAFKRNELEIGDKKCCLKREGMPDETAFVVKEKFIKTFDARKRNGFDNCLYFYNGRFEKFGDVSENKKRKTAVASICVTAIACVIAVTLIIIDFFA